MKFEDTHGRSYFERRYVQRPERIEIPLPEGSLSVLNFIKLYLFKGATMLDSMVVEFTQPDKAAENDFEILLWNLGHQSIRHRKYLEAVRDSNLCHPLITLTNLQCQ